MPPPKPPSPLPSMEDGPARVAPIPFSPKRGASQFGFDVGQPTLPMPEHAGEAQSMPGVSSSSSFVPPSSQGAYAPFQVDPDDMSDDQ